MDRITAIKSFVEVAHFASFTKAADKLDLSRLQVSRHVQELEQWLQQRLLHRTTRRVSLTQEGERALVRFERILDETSALLAQSYIDKTELSGTIRVSSPIGFAQTMLIEAVSVFLSKRDKVTIDIHANDSFSDLVEQRIDVALRYTNTPEESLIARPLMNIGSCICASKHYIEQYSQPKSPVDLAEHKCLVHLAHDRWRFVKNGQEHYINVSGSLICNDVTTILAATLKGNGISLLPYDIARTHVEKGHLLPLLTDYQIATTQLWAVYLSRSYQTPLVRAFIDYLAERWDGDIVPGYQNQLISG